LLFLINHTIRIVSQFGNTSQRVYCLNIFFRIHETEKENIRIEQSKLVLVTNFFIHQIFFRLSFSLLISLID